MATTENERAVVGHNQPPAHIAMEAHVLDLLETAKGFLDGEPIETEGVAAEVAKLIDEGRKAGKDADALRKDEAKPFDEGKKAVQARWKPIIDKAELIVSTAKQALVPYQLKLEREQREAAEKARREAEEARQAQITAERAARDAADLEAAERAEELRKTADKAEREANRAEKAAPVIAVEGARGIGLRSYWIAEITDRREALKHYMVAQPEALTAWLLDQAQKDVNAGKRSIPGVNIREDRRAA